MSDKNSNLHSEAAHVKIHHGTIEVQVNMKLFALKVSGSLGKCDFCCCSLLPRYWLRVTQAKRRNAYQNHGGSCRPRIFVSKPARPRLTLDKGPSDELLQGQEFAAFGVASQFNVFIT